jgi:hypothetical protein
VGVVNGSNVTIMIDGVVIGETQSITMSREEEPRELGFSGLSYPIEGTLTVENAMVCDLTRGYEEFMAKRRRLAVYEEQARQALKELRKKSYRARARQMGAGWWVE